MNTTQKILLNAFSACCSVLLVHWLLRPERFMLITGGVAAFTFLTIEDLVKDKPWKKK